MSACMSVRIREPALVAAHTCIIEKLVVMSLNATRTIRASQWRPLVLRPPQLCDNTNQKQQLFQRGEDAGLTMRRESECGGRSVRR